MTQPLSVEEACRLAWNFQTAGRLVEALQIYRKVLEEPAANQAARERGILGKVYHNTADVLHRLGATDDAIMALRAAIQDTEGGELDLEFEAAYLDGLRASGTSPTPFERRHRFWNLVELFRGTAGVAGDVAECGCFRGLSSYVLCRELRREKAGFDGSGFHILDSFQGLSEPVEADRIPAGHNREEDLRKMLRKGHFAAPLEVVRATLADFPRIEYHPGWIPETFTGLPEREYRFVNVDVDLYVPTRAAFQYFYRRLAVGGRIVTDDYNWPGARRGLAEFCEAAGVELTMTDRGQAWTEKRG